MAEYDNLLFKIDARRSEWSEDWKPVAESDIDLLTQSASALRALQTENTELRARAEIAEMTLSAHRMNGAASEAMAIRLRDAERVITEIQDWREWADKEYGVWQVKPGASSRTGMRLTEILSSYPLGEGQTPRPWECVRDPGCLENPGRHSVRCQFANENRADYEGQAQQGDER